MQFISCVVICALLVLSPGCAGLKKERAVSSYSFDGKVLDTDKLKAGGKIFLVPFSAGVGVEASEALDEAALMLIKGIYEELSATNSVLTVLTSEQGASPDFILRGHFIRWSSASAGGIKRLLPGGPQRVIGIEGEVVERSTGKVLIHFSDIKEAVEKADDHRVLGFDIGKDVGRFILTAIR